MPTKRANSPSYSRAHFLDRARERYNLALSPGDYDAVDAAVRACRAGTAAAPLPSSSSVAAAGPTNATLLGREKGDEFWGVEWPRRSASPFAPASVPVAVSAGRAAAAGKDGSGARRGIGPEMGTRTARGGGVGAGDERAGADGRAGGDGDGDEANGGDVGGEMTPPATTTVGLICVWNVVEERVTTALPEGTVVRSDGRRRSNR